MLKAKVRTKIRKLFLVEDDGVPDDSFVSWGISRTERIMAAGLTLRDQDGKEATLTSAISSTRELAIAIQRIERLQTAITSMLEMLDGLVQESEEGE